MKSNENHNASNRADDNSSPPKTSTLARRRHHRWRTFGIVLLAIALLLGVTRAFLPLIVRDYVNRTLDRNILYEGRIGKVEIHLWRGAYSIHNIQISKRSGNIPVPFFAASNVDFSVEWKALMHGHVVGQVAMEAPELNFVDNPTADGESQTGAGGPWLEIIRDLFPFQINSAAIRNGAIHFRAFQSQKPVDIYLSHVDGTINDLGNVADQTKPLVTTVQATALAMDQAKLECKMALDPFSYRPTFHLAVRLLGLDVTKLNDFAKTYGKFDFKRGWFDLIVEADSKEGQISGYVKPLFRNLQVFSLREDIQQDNVLQFFWQALIGGVTTAFKNFSRDQFGTLIPFSADASGATTTDIFSTVGNILRNAFVRAYLPRLEPQQAGEESVEFGPPEFTEAIATSGENQ
jgi:hypothetical protein